MQWWFGGASIEQHKTDGTPLSLDSCVWWKVAPPVGFPPWQWMQNPKNEGLYDDFPWSTRRFARSNVNFQGCFFTLYEEHVTACPSPNLQLVASGQTSVRCLSWNSESLPLLEHSMTGDLCHNDDSHPSIQLRQLRPSLTGVMMCDVFFFFVLKYFW